MPQTILHELTNRELSSFNYLHHDPSCWISRSFNSQEFLNEGRGIRGRMPRAVLIRVLDTINRDLLKRWESDLIFRKGFQRVEFLAAFSFDDAGKPLNRDDFLEQYLDISKSVRNDEPFGIHIERSTVISAEGGAAKLTSESAVVRWEPPFSIELEQMAQGIEVMGELFEFWIRKQKLWKAIQTPIDFEIGYSPTRLKVKTADFMNGLV